jgi:hypothetical protein
MGGAFRAIVVGALSEYVAGPRDIPALNVILVGWRRVCVADSGERRLTLFPIVVG